MSVEAQAFYVTILVIVTSVLAVIVIAAEFYGLVRSIIDSCKLKRRKEQMEKEKNESNKGNQL